MRPIENLDLYPMLASGFVFLLRAKKVPNQTEQQLLLPCLFGAVFFSIYLFLNGTAQVVIHVVEFNLIVYCWKLKLVQGYG